MAAPLGLVFIACKTPNAAHPLAAQENTSRSADAAQQREIDSLRAAVKEQAAQIQKVSERLAAAQSSPPMLVKNW